MGSVAADFGAEGGTPIVNRDSILASVDAALGCDGPPAIEYLFVAPFGSTTFLGIRLGSPYGHSVIRYTLPDGQQRVMNIVKDQGDGAQLVNFIDPTSYLYGTSFTATGAVQGGAYNRRIVGVRIEKWDDDLVQDLDYYYEKMKRRESKRNATFSLVLGPLFNFLRSHVPEGLALAETGNCARWTSAGLVFADLLQANRIWPKQIFVDLFERYGLENKDNVHVVVYEHIPHAHQTFGDGSPLWFEGVSPFAYVADVLYADLAKFAHVIVRVPEGSMEAVIEKQPNPLEPSFLRWRKSYIVGGSLATAYLARKLYLRLSRGRQENRGPSIPQRVRDIVRNRRLMRWAQSVIRRK